MEMEQILKSWREIAEFLRVSPRTAQLWEQDSGLPVHRHAGKTRGTVFAYKDELMEWTRRQEEDDYESPDFDDSGQEREGERPQAAPQPKRRMMLGQILAVALGVSLLWVMILLLYLQ